MQFQDIIGHTELKEQLIRTVQADRISHAQLFTGGAGSGVLPLALAYVQYINCPNRTDGDSCGVCPSCVQIASLAHPDLHMIYPVNKQGKKSGESITSGDFIELFRGEFVAAEGYLSPNMWYGALDLGRTLKGAISAKEADAIIQKLSFKSFSGGYKCVVVWLPEAMSEEASNKILKILEEPWQRTLFVLVSESPDMLLSTIRSRTQQVEVPPIAHSDLESYALANGAANPEQATQLARRAAGDAIVLKQLLSGDDELQDDDIFELFCGLMRLSYNDRHLELVEWAEQLAQLPRERMRHFFLMAAAMLRESYMIHAGVGQISTLSGNRLKFCSNFAPFVGNQNIETFIAEIEPAKMQIERNGNPTIVLTHFALAVSKLVVK